MTWMGLSWVAACALQAEVREGGTVECLNPDLRSQAGPFELKQQPQNHLAAANLHGGGLLVEDLDGDGWLDLFAPGESEQVLRWGRDTWPAVPFDVGDDALEGLPLGHAVGATAVDYDDDGDLDVYVTRWERPNTLLRNDGRRRFSDATEQAFPGSTGTTSQSASWADVDGDGDLDLFVGTYGEETLINPNDDAPDCSDHEPDFAQLWRNEGDGTFADISGTLPPETRGYTFMSGFYDVDHDGFPELFLAHDDGICGPGVVLDNQRGTFVVDEDAGFARGSHDMGMGVGDLNGDRHPDFVLTSWNTVSLLLSTGQGADLHWIEGADAMGLAVAGTPGGQPARAGDQVFGWGAELGDVDNDGDLDAAMVFGFWSYFPRAADPLRQSDGLWLQGPDGFTDIAASVGLDEPGVSRGVVLADASNDGYLDVFKHTLDTGIPLHASRCGDASWVKIRLRGTRPNRFAVGARITVIAGDQTHTRWVTSGSTGMYTGAPLEAHVGLGGADHIDRIEVDWPDGARSVHQDLAARQILTVSR